MKNGNNISIKKYILKMALPAIAGLSTQMVVSLVDTSMVGRLNEAEYALAAMGLGVLATWALISFFSSLATGTHVMVARRFGSGDMEGCGKVLNSSLILTFIVGIIVGFIGVSSAHRIAHFFAADSQVGNYAGEFLFYRFMGIPFFLVTVSYRGFFFGIGKTKVFMFSGILVNLLNIIFNYFLIFGHLGLPKMGVAGSGLGSTLATMCEVMFYIGVSFYPKYSRKFKYFQNFRFNNDIVKSIYRISLPVSLQNVFILVAFLSFVAITGLIGTVQQAATQLVISSIFISLLPCFGFGIAAQTLVGNNLGSKKITLARVYAIETSKLATYYTLLIGAVFLITPRLILHLLTTESRVVETAVPALRIAGFAQIFYAAGIVLANTLQAAGKTFFVMMSEVLTSWILFLPLSYFFGVFLKFGLLGAWGALPLYVLSYTIVVYVKFSRGNWSKAAV
ncbi:MAG TPA: MATE family efflux transporter [Ignavibacteriales bacterium]|nr:MATE family efflux transporter [Ignavibacteriales bacterium]